MSQPNPRGNADAAEPTALHAVPVADLAPERQPVPTPEPVAITTAPVAVIADEPYVGTLRRLWDRAITWPWWLQVTILFVLSRIVTTIWLRYFASIQFTNAWTNAQPGYTDYATIWDGNWYKIVAMSGYPTELPLDADGQITQNAWAFMPVYPVVVRALMLVTGFSWPYASVIVSVVCAFAATLVLYKLLRIKLDHNRTIWAVLLFLVAPLSPILQVSYAESMQLLFLFVALILVLRRRYLWLIPVVIVMSFVRPTGLAFALFLGLHFLLRWYRHRRGDPFAVREWVSLMVAGLVSALAGFGWFLIAGAVTGNVAAYTDTELAWRAAYIGYGELIPFSAWIEGANWWLRYTFQYPGALWAVAVLVVLALIAGFVLLLRSRGARELGDDLRLWSASYAIYLLAVFFPQSSTFRLLMPMAPLVGAVPIPKRVVWRVVIVGISVLLQGAWLWQCWWVGGSDWSPP